ncbi:MAG: fibronectin type III domain-containing protein [Paludibacteraceae bacterium]|nr:fibronectin type III domain-containing protein [Paludibacteraceae bacterium]
MRTFTQKLAFLLVTLLCCAGLQVKADELTVADGTAQNYYLPIYGSYVDTQGSHQQSLYPAELISDMAGGSISKVTFYRTSSASSWGSPTIRVRLGETSDENLANAFVADADLTEVFSGVLDGAGDVFEIEFTTPYDYAGENLVVDFYVVSASSTYEGSYFYGESSYSSASRYYTSYGSGTVQDFLAKATFEYTAGSGPSCKRPASITASNITVSSADLNWENGENGSGVFTVEYKKKADADWTELIANTTALSASLSDLQPGTDYQARVKAVCAADEMESSYTSVAFKTAYGMPFAEDFESSGSSLPAGWIRATGLMADVTAGTATLTETTYSSWSLTTSALEEMGNHAYISLSSSSTNGWLITPEMVLNESSAQLTFVIAYANNYYNSTYTTLASPTAGKSDVKFAVLISTDNGLSWTLLSQWDNAGSANVLDNISATGDEITLDLSSYAGQNVKVAFYGESTVYSYSSYYLNLDAIKIALPPACTKPTDLALTEGTIGVGEAELGWTENNGKEAWKIQYKKASETDWTTVDAPSNPFTLSGLLGNTTYNVRVATVCDEEGGLSDYSVAVSFTTLVGVPFLEEFNTAYSKPDGWQGSTTTLTTALSNGMTPSTSTSWSFGTRTGLFDGSCHAYFNLYGSRSYWLITPAIVLENPAILSFDLALTAYGAISAAAAAPDDRFVVLISTDGQNWTILREWNNIGSADVFDEIPTAGGNFQIEIGDEYAGNAVMIAFCGESTVSNGDNDLHIDNVKIDAIPDCPKPSGFAAAEITKSSALVSWKRHDYDTGWKLQYKKSASAEWSEDIVLTDNSYTLSGLEVYTRYDVRVAANCDVEGEAQSTDYSTVFSFKTAAGVPFFESFNATAVPADWTRFSGLYDEEEGVELVAAAGWNVGAANGVFPAADGHLNLQISGDATHSWIVSPTIEIEENTQLTFDLALTKTSGSLVPVESGVQNDHKFIVFYSANNGETWEILKGWGQDYDDAFDNISSSAGGQTIALDLSEHAGENLIIAFYGESSDANTSANNTIHIANVRVDYIPDCSNSASLVVNNLSAFGATFVWDEEDGALWEFGIKKNPAADFVPANEDFIGSTEEYLVSVDTLSENTPYVFFLRRNCAGAYSEIKTLNFRTIQNPAAMPFADDFEDGNKWVFINGDLTNAWSYGTAVNNGGSHALYISNDNGVTHAYTANAAAMVYATKVLAFDETAIYQVSFDWLCNCSGDSYSDYLRVALVPLSEELAASTTTPSGFDTSTLPEGWIALDGGSRLSGQNSWQTVSQEIQIPAGTYKLVLAWRNNAYSGTNPPAAVDNIAISVMACPTPGNLSVVENAATTSSVQLQWTAAAGEDAWMIQYKKSSDAEWSTFAEPATEHPFTLSGLEASTKYDARVAAWCDTDSEEGISLFTAPVSFYTACGIVANFPYSEDFNGITGSSYDHVLPICWDYINTCTVEDFEIYPSVSTTNALFFGSQFEVEDYYGYTEPADPQDQYAILPQMDDLSNKRIKLDARAYSSYYVATFEIGIMTNPADTSTFVSLGSFTPASTSYQQFKLNLDSYEGEGKYIAIKMAAATSSEDHAVYIDNIVVEEIPACADIESVITVSDITAASATVSWTVEEGVSYKYAYASAHEAVPADEAFTTAEGNTVALSELADNADYTFYLRGDCGTSLSLPVTASFHTTQLPVNAPFSDDMEDGNKWLFVNGTSTNAWAYGTAAHNGEGSHAVYISNNGGAANAYNTSSTTIVFATRLCDFEAGTYAFSYDWKANGEGSYDYLRVALIPASETLTAGSTPTSFATSTLPAGWIALDGGSKLNGVSSWQHFESAEIEIPAGSYKLVLAWKNNYSGGSQEPAALDNFSVRTITCSKPTNLQAANLTSSSADITWTAAAENIQLVYSTDASFNPDEAEIINVTANPFALAALTEQTNYYVYLRANCGEGEFSAWSQKLAFATKSSCETPTDLSVSAITTSSAAISWEKYGQESFNLRYIQGTDTTVVSAVACPYTISGLSANTAYRVQVQPVCAEADAWSASITFRTECASLVIDENGWDENFDALTIASEYTPSVRTLPSCWSAINTTTYSSYSVYPTAYYYSYTNYASSTPNSLRFYSYYYSYTDYDPQDQYAVLPQMDAVNTLRMSLKARAYDTYSSYDATFIVGVMSDPADTATFVPVATFKPTSTSYSDYQVAFNSYAGAGQYIAIKMEKANASTSTHALYIDNIHVELLPSCLELSDVAVSDITATTAQVSWTNGSDDQSAWQIALGTEASFDKDAVTPIDADANPFTLTDLTPETTYYIYVRANCGEGEFSAWSQKLAFATKSSCETPTDLSVSAITTSSAAISWEKYGQESFNLRYIQGTDTTVVSAVACPYTISGLSANTAYRVQVQPVCAEADTWSSVFTFKTAYGVPFEEHFTASSTPADWSLYSGLLSSVQSGTALTSATYGWSFGTRNSIFGSSHAYSNIYGTSSNKWLATPAITLTEDVQLSFDLALTKYNSASAVTAGQQADDKFAVLISTDNGASWDTLRIWDNQGSEYVYDAITNSANGDPVVIDLSAYTGRSVIIAFYGESTVDTGGDNDLHIGNVLIDAAPACVKPTGLTISNVSSDAATFTWTAEEGAAYQIAVIANPNGDFVPADDDFADAVTNTVTVDTLAENTAYVVYLRTNCGEDGYSEIISKAFHTKLVPAALPYDDDFESGNNWQLINGDLTNAWAVGSGANNTENGANALYISNDGGTTNAYNEGSQAVVFAVKIFDFDKAGSYTFSYDWRSNGEAGYSIYDYLRVLLAPSSAELTAGTLPSGLTASAVPADWIALDGGALVSATEWQHKDVTVDDINPGLYQIVFVWRNDGSTGSQTPAAIDNIHIQHLAYPTGINETGAGIENKAVKFIYNNQVYILLNGNVYNITGQKVELR